MGLREYRRKRRFDRTPEPAGKRRAARRGASFVVQKHAASRLHYDFRLEMEGVLRSWAVPKGPSLDPAQKRLAAHVEDHPLEYGGFEGVIPKGEYGGGTVLLWDRGTWRPDGDPVAAYKKGKIAFDLRGEKLRGRWALVRMGGPRHAGGKEWLLIKEKDGEARPGRGSSLVDKRPESVLTGRSMDEIAAAEDRVWTKEGERRPARKSRAPSRGAKGVPMPRTLAPQLATLVEEAPAGAEWLHEIKFDGYRIVCRVSGGTARLLTRTGLDWTSRFPALAAAAAELPVREALIDGEAVLVGADGITDFQSLQNALSEGRAGDVTYFAFDLLHLDGRDLRGAPLLERKAALAALLGGAGGTIRYSDHVTGRGSQFFRHACRMAVEGVVSKRADGPYAPGRSRDWLKVKCVRGQEVVIVGFTEPKGQRSGFGALLVGVHDDGRLRFAGKVGTGFTQTSLADLHRKLRTIETKTPPVAGPPAGSARGVHWVKPSLVAEVSFTEWTRDGRMRHPSFKGLRTDKPPREIVRERAARPGAAAAKTRAERKAPPAAPDSEVAGVVLTHPDRVLYPSQGVTKIELARWYESVAGRMLPEVAGRPLTLVRCPQGQGSKCFFQKHATESTAEGIARIAVRQSDGSTAQYMEIRDAAGLAALVQMGVLEIHTWGSRSDDLERPDRIVFDLDPDPSVGWRGVVDGALEVRDRLAGAGLESFVKSTGGKGLHVVVPLRGAASWDDAKEFAKSVAVAMAADSPERYVAGMSKAARKGRIFVDWLRNVRGATAVAPYSSRAREGAPVSMPLAWKDLRAPSAPEFSVRGPLPRGADPWKRMASVRQSLTAAVRRRMNLPPK